MAIEHLITGATGFVGGALALELLEHTADVLWCGVRTPGDQGQARLHASLEQAARAYDVGHLVGAIRSRCKAFYLDLEREPSAEHLPAPQGDRVFWHVAASLRYEDKHREQIFRDNLDGTRRALAAARLAGARRFNYMSTAYVFGKSTGALEEIVPEGDVAASNVYEVSKLCAERLVWDERELESRILRPSIVIGHSKTLAATSFTGLYGFLREVRLFERKVENRLGKILSMRPLAIMVQADAPINFIPVDAVARDAMAVGLAATDRRVFHLTNDDPPRVGEALDAAFDELSLPRPRRVASPKSFTTIDQTLHDHLEFYSSYMNSQKRFSRANTDAIVGAGRGRWPLPTERFREIARWYLDHLEAERQARQRRSAARATSGAA